MELFSSCCGAAPWLGDPVHERCSDCKENCSFEYHVPYLTEDEEQTLIIPYQPHDD